VEVKRPGILPSILMDICYGLFALICSPVYVPMILGRKKWRANFLERLGIVPRLKSHPLRLWVHAISVGEVEAARSFVPALAEAFPDAEVVISTTTLTGRERAKRLFPDHLIFHFPLDVSPSVMSAISRIKPTAIIQVEAEWWPNFFIKAARRAIPVIAVNVRITEKGLKGYQKIRPLVRVMLNAATAIGTQSQLYADRLISLGADKGRIKVTGQMKYDNVSLQQVAGAGELAERCRLDADAPLIVAGSTGPGEPEILLRIYRKLKAKYKGLRLAIVPRRPEQFEETAAQIKQAGFGLFRLSQADEQAAAADNDAVILGDTMGELMKFYQLADIVFIGRSLVPLGGSNLIEPASLGKPAVFGPHMFNFAEPADYFLGRGAARQVKNESELVETLDELLASPDKRRETGDRGRECIAEQQGATQRNIQLVKEILGVRG